MKTYILYILVLLFTVCFVGCHKQETQPLAPVKGDIATFRAEFLGKNLSIAESAEDSIYSDSGIGYLLENNQKPSFIYIQASIITIPNRSGDRIHLYFPTIKTEDFTFEGMQKLLSIGKKEFEISPVFDKNMSYNFSFNRGFIFTLSTQNPALSEGGYRRFFDTVGEQNGSELKVIESKEIFPSAGYERAIQVRFSLNCKLYSGIQFIGNLKDADFSLKFNYKKPDF